VNPGSNATFQLYVTGSNVQGQNPNQIASYLDTGAYNAGFSSGNFSTLAFVGAIGGSPNGNENFAGLAFVPGYHTLTTLASSNDPAVFGDPVTLTATVTAPSGTPTGVVNFYDGTTLLGSAFIDGNGVASITISLLGAGDHMITAVYNGDVADGISTSTVLTQTITALPPGPRQAAPDGDHTPFGIPGTVVNTAPVVAQLPILTPSATGAKRPAHDRAGSSGVHAPRNADVDAFWQIWMAADRQMDSEWSLALTER
jgi:hypothetical protein